MRELLVGFDSAWAGRAPGALCAAAFGAGSPIFHPPVPAGFDDAQARIAHWGTEADYVLLAIDQSVVVRNAAGMRPVERAAASVVSWLGGGVQPSHTGRTGLFCAAAPLWPFLNRFDGCDEPAPARAATRGRYVIEVFPALALAGLNDDFCKRLQGPRYNPARRTFRIEAWQAVCAVAAQAFAGHGLDAAAAWCAAVQALARPRKADQDALDAMLCLLVALRWRHGAPADALVLGCNETGYMVLPASPALRARLVPAAAARGVPIDGVIPAAG